MISEQRLDALMKSSSVDFEDDFAIDAVMDFFEFMVKDLGNPITDSDIFSLKSAWIRQGK